MQRLRARRKGGRDLRVRRYVRYRLLQKTDEAQEKGLGSQSQLSDLSSQEDLSQSLTTFQMGEGGRCRIRR